MLTSIPAPRLRALGKRAQLEPDSSIMNLFAVYSSTILILAGGLLLGLAIIGTIDPDAFTQTVMTTDIGLHLDLIQLFNGNAYYQTTYPSTEQQVSIIQNTVVINKSGQATGFTLAIDQSHVLKETTLLPSPIYFSTSAGILAASNNAHDHNPFELRCPSITPPIATITLDAERPTDERILRTLLRLAQTNPSVYTLSTQRDVPQSSRTYASDAILALRQTTDDRRLIKIYYDPANEHSESFACPILNALSKKLWQSGALLDGASLIPYNPARSTLETNSLTLLNKPQPAIVIELTVPSGESFDDRAIADALATTTPTTTAIT